MIPFVFIALIVFTLSFFMSMLSPIDMISVIDYNKNFAYSMLAVGDAAAQYSRLNPNASGLIPESAYSQYYKAGFNGNQGKFVVQIDATTGNIYVSTSGPSVQPQRQIDVMQKILKCSAMAGYVNNSHLVVPCDNWNSAAQVPFSMQNNTLVYITHR